MSKSKPKRHHWWPQLQSKYWIDNDGCISCYDLKSQKSFRTQPANIGVEGQLYAKELHDGSLDPSIETWFANEVDTPFAKAFDSLFDLNRIQKQLYRPDPEKIPLNKKLGFEVDENYRHLIALNETQRLVLSSYLAGLVVRTPIYIKKLVDWHEKENADFGDFKNLALENMRWLHEIYKEKIFNADIMLLRRSGNNEFLYGDNAVHIAEPWRVGPLPFDLYAPMTPDFSVNVLPVGGAQFPSHMLVSKGKNKLVARYNHKVVAQSDRFIFSKSTMPIQFIEKFKGKKVPAPFGIRKVRGKVEVKYDPDRDK